MFIDRFPDIPDEEFKNKCNDIIVYNKIDHKIYRLLNNDNNLSEIFMEGLSDYLKAQLFDIEQIDFGELINKFNNLEEKLNLLKFYPIENFNLVNYSYSIINKLFAP